MRTIAEIDKSIDAVTDLLMCLETIDPLSFESWDEAWTNHPDLDVERDALFLERGIAQQARDEAAEKAYRRSSRRKPTPRSIYAKCPTCGCHTLEQAA